MANKLRSPATIGDISQRDTDVLLAAVFLAAEVRRAQKAYFANRSAPNALELLTASKEVERRLDIALDHVCLGAQQGLSL